MFCERCQTFISTEKLPPDLNEAVGYGVVRIIATILWRNRGNFIPTQRLIDAVYLGAELPKTAERCINVEMYRLRKMLPEGYRIESRHSFGRRMIVEKKS